MSFVKSIVRQFSGSSSSIETVEKKLERERAQRHSDYEQLKMTKMANASYQRGGLSLQDDLLRSAQQKLSRQASYGSERPRSFSRTSARSRESSFELIDRSREGSFHEIDPMEYMGEEFVVVEAITALEEAQAMQQEDTDVYTHTVVNSIVRELVDTVSKKSITKSLAMRYTKEWIEAAMAKRENHEKAPAMYMRYKKIQPFVQETIARELAKSTVKTALIAGVKAAEAIVSEQTLMKANDLNVGIENNENSIRDLAKKTTEKSLESAMKSAQVILNERALMQDQDKVAQFDKIACENTSTASLAASPTIPEEIHVEKNSDAVIKNRVSAQASEDLVAFYAQRKKLQLERSKKNRMDEHEKMSALAQHKSWSRVLTLIDCPEDVNFATVTPSIARMFGILQAHAA
ncbi:hypothetical protein THRCLA_20405 [Thraustotheca clavata]|uniref:Uncharacterized protein n=1 Tax=Thraustotheca clavata TaxID=74557 RepID=A0A1W0A7T5_9STRA|nr:hypothetical protein THRCLA_20405 [Thraustotheca clavata]